MVALRTFSVIAGGAGITKSASRPRLEVVYSAPSRPRMPWSRRSAGQLRLVTSVLSPDMIVTPVRFTRVVRPWRVVSQVFARPAPQHGIADVMVSLSSQGKPPTRSPAGAELVCYVAGSGGIGTHQSHVCSPAGTRLYSHQEGQSQPQWDYYRRYVSWSYARKVEPNYLGDLEKGYGVMYYYSDSLGLNWAQKQADAAALERMLNLPRYAPVALPSLVPGIRVSPALRPPSSMRWPFGHMVEGVQYGRSVRPRLAYARARQRPRGNERKQQLPRAALAFIDFGWDVLEYLPIIERNILNPMLGKKAEKMTPYQKFRAALENWDASKIDWLGLVFDITAEVMEDKSVGIIAQRMKAEYGPWNSVAPSRQLGLVLQSYGLAISG